MPPEMESAAAAAPAVRALSCPSCGGTISLRAAGYTVTVACQYCSSILDVANPDVRLIKEFHEAAAELEIPLGTRGTLRGVEWEVIGFMSRSEGELPFTAEPGWTIFSVDFRSPTGRVASLQREKGLSSFYDGRYVTLAELAPRGLRAIEGWPMPAFGG